MSTLTPRLALSTLLGSTAALLALALTSPARADMLCGGGHPPPEPPSPSPTTSTSSSAGPFARPPVGRGESGVALDTREASRHQSAVEFGMVSGMAFLGVFAGLSSRKKKDKQS